MYSGCIPLGTEISLPTGYPFHSRTPLTDGKVLFLSELELKLSSYRCHCHILELRLALAPQNAPAMSSSTISSLPLTSAPTSLPRPVTSCTTRPLAHPQLLSRLLALLQSYWHLFLHCTKHRPTLGPLQVPFPLPGCSFCEFPSQGSQLSVTSSKKRSLAILAEVFPNSHVFLRGFLSDYKAAQHSPLFLLLSAQFECEPPRDTSVSYSCCYPKSSTQ